MRKKLRARWIVLAVVLVGAGLVAARLLRPVDVVVTQVVRGHVVDAVYATGTVEAEHRVVVKAKIAGAIAELPVTEGEAVHARQVLALVDNPAASFELQRGQVEAAAATAQAGQGAPQLASLQARADEVDAKLKAARREVERQEMLVEKGAAGRIDLDRARDRVSELAAQVDGLRAESRARRIELEANQGRAKAAVRSLATRVTDAEVRAPLDGVLLARYVEPGEVVAVNQRLFKVGDPSSLLLEVTIDEADVGRVHDGSDGLPASKVAASLHAFPGRAFAGHVVKVLPDADREKKSYLAKVRLDDKVMGLRSGMTAEVNIIIRERQGVPLAPADAIKDGQVWRVEGGRATRRAVTIGIHDLLRAEVISGLADGDQVVIGGQELLKGDRPRVRPTVQKPDPLQTKAP